MCAGGCQSCVSTTCANLRASELTTGTISSPPATASGGGSPPATIPPPPATPSAPPVPLTAGQKSFCRSITSSTSVAELSTMSKFGTIPCAAGDDSAGGLVGWCSVDRGAVVMSRVTLFSLLLALLLGVGIRLWYDGQRGACTPSLAGDSKSQKSEWVI